MCYLRIYTYKSKVASSNKICQRTLKTIYLNIKKPASWQVFVLSACYISDCDLWSDEEVMVCNFFFKLVYISNAYFFTFFSK